MIMEQNASSLKPFFLDYYQQKSSSLDVGWYDKYKALAEQVNHVFKETRTISDELLEVLWCQQYNGTALISTQAVIPKESFGAIKNDLRHITIQIFKSSDKETYNNVSKEMLLLKAEGKLTKNYQAVKDRLYSLIHPEKFTTIVKREMFSKVYDFLNNKFSLKLPKHDSWYTSNIDLKKILNDELANHLDAFMINIILWEIFHTFSHDTHINNDEDGDEVDEVVSTDFALNQIFYGPPGTGKTYHTINIALSMIGIDIQGKDRQTLKQIFDEKVEAGQIVFTTFHQSTCYEDFIEGIKPILDDSCEQSQICYQIQEGVFKQLANKAKIGNLSKTLSIDQAIEKFKETCVEQKVTLQTSTSKLFDVKYHGNTTFRCYPQNSINDDLGNGYAASIRNIVEYIVSGESKTTAYNPSYVRAIGEYLKLNYQLDVNKPSKDKKQNFVLIIDEINRGNVSQIFGELITLIEDDKRLGNSEALTVTLPYSKQKFGVPNNLYIIGTMNTADRSVEALDTALRRRFCFTEMRPQPALLNAEQHNSTEVNQFPLNEILSTINKRLEILLDRDHQIGHSYFMNIQHLDELCDVFNNNVIPLLQEYFFNDYAKIGLVLGNGFVEKINTDTHQNNIFAEFDDEHDTAYQYQDKIVYRLNKIAPDTLSKALSSLLHRNIKQ